MHTILLQISLDPHDLALLRKEFPQYRIVYSQFAPLLGKESSHEKEWSQVEIFYGNRLSVHQMMLAKDLRWVHNTTSSFSRICLEDILKRDNVIVTIPGDENIIPIGEYVMGGILGISKNLFHWHDLMSAPAKVWDANWRDSMWTLSNKTFLQIGLGKIGSEICRRARQYDMKVWGMQEKRSFHPHCHETFTFDSLESILPLVDIVSVCLDRDHPKPNLFNMSELNLMKNNSILIVIGAHNVVNEQALVSIGSAGKFRGVILDTLYSPSIPPNSPLWKVPNLLITPEVASRPRLSSRQGFHTFYYNLRQYSIGNFSDMRNRVER